MAVRKANATWEGDLKTGKGRFDGESGAIGGGYSFGTRFGEDPGTNPEELLAAAESACYSMALAVAIEKAGGTPERVRTDAACTLEKVGEGFKITSMRLTVRARASGIDEQAFQEAARQTKEGCPVSQALAGVDIELDATLE